MKVKTIDSWYKKQWNVFSVLIMMAARTILLLLISLFLLWMVYYYWRNIDHHHHHTKMQQTSLIYDDHPSNIIHDQIHNDYNTIQYNNHNHTNNHNTTEGRIIFNFEIDFGGIRNNESYSQYNTNLLSYILQYHASDHILQIGFTNTSEEEQQPIIYYFQPGIYAQHIYNTTIRIDAIIRFVKHPSPSPPPNHTNQDSMIHRHHTHPPMACIMIDKSHDIIITSSFSSLSSSKQQQQHRGIIDGQGSYYWGIPIIGYIEHGEYRPRLLRMNLTSNVLIEHIIFQDSPYHTIYLQAVKNVIIRYCSIVTRRTYHDGHHWIDLSAFNTDGIDVSGTNVHVHDVDIWTQDDCIAVKDNDYPPYQSTNMIFERINCSGLGLVIGSIGYTMVQNITFRDSYIHKSVKGLYLKFHPYDTEYWYNKIHHYGQIRDITYSNIIMEQPSQWPIWIGPAQQSDDPNNICYANPCSLCWPQNPLSKCHVVNQSKFYHLVFENIQINNPFMSPGVILGQNDNNDTNYNNTTTTIVNIPNDHQMIDTIIFNNVQVTKGIPVPYARMERTITFPGLLQPIHDQYVPNQYHNHRMYTPFWLTMMDVSSSSWLLLMIFFIVVTFSVLIQQVPTGTWKQRSNILLLLSSGICLFVVWMMYYSIYDMVLPSRLPFYKMIDRYLGIWDTTYYYFSIRPKWNQRNHYYRCIGVSNGIAMNGTWPIPYCFTSSSS